MPEFLVRLVQVHESFRKAELIALAEVAGVEIEIVRYLEDVGIFHLKLLSHRQPNLPPYQGCSSLYICSLTIIVSLLHHLLVI